MKGDLPVRDTGSHSLKPGSSLLLDQLYTRSSFYFSVRQLMVQEEAIVSLTKSLAAVQSARSKSLRDTGETAGRAPRYLKKIYIHIL